ncbi:metacaspase-2-like isoform X2 [Lucilia cuprina]|nr:metacaspase-2-like isoform X2 [Lucilia cuprina]
MQSHTSTLNIQSSSHNGQATHLKTHTKLETKTSVANQIHYSLTAHPFKDDNFLYNIHNGESKIEHHHSLHHNIVHIYTQAHPSHNSTGYIKTDRYVRKTINSQKSIVNSNHFNTNTIYSNSKTHIKAHTKLETKTTSTNVSVHPFRDKYFIYNNRQGENSITHQHFSNHNYVHIYTQAHQCKNFTPVTTSNKPPEIGSNINTLKKNTTLVNILQNKNLTKIITEQANKILQNSIYKQLETNFTTHRNVTNGSEKVLNNYPISKNNSHNNTEKNKKKSFQIFKDMAHFVSEQVTKTIGNSSEDTNTVNDIEKDFINNKQDNNVNEMKKKKYFNIFKNKNLINVVLEEARKIIENSTSNAKTDNDTVKKMRTSFKIFKNKNLTNIISEQARKISQRINENNSNVNSTSLKPKTKSDNGKKKYAILFRVFKNKNLLNIISDQSRKRMHTTKKPTDIDSTTPTSIQTNTKIVPENDIKNSNITPNVKSNNDTEQEKITTFKIFKNKNLTNFLLDRARKILDTTTKTTDIDSKTPTSIQTNTNTNIVPEKDIENMKKHVTNLISDQARKIVHTTTKPTNINNSTQSAIKPKKDIKNSNTMPTTVRSDNGTEQEKVTTFKMFKNKNLTNFISNQARKIVHTTTKPTNINNSTQSPTKPNTKTVTEKDIKNSNTTTNVKSDNGTEQENITTFKLFKNKNITNFISDQARKIVHTTTKLIDINNSTQSAIKLNTKIVPEKDIKNSNTTLNVKSDNGTEQEKVTNFKIFNNKNLTNIISEQARQISQSINDNNTDVKSTTLKPKTNTDIENKKNVTTPFKIFKNKNLKNFISDQARKIKQTTIKPTDIENDKEFIEITTSKNSEHSTTNIPFVWINDVPLAR